MQSFKIIFFFTSVTAGAMAKDDFDDDFFQKCIMQMQVFLV